MGFYDPPVGCRDELAIHSQVEAENEAYLKIVGFLQTYNRSNPDSPSKPQTIDSFVPELDAHLTPEEKKVIVITNYRFLERKYIEKFNADGKARSGSEKLEREITGLLARRENLIDKINLWADDTSNPHSPCRQWFAEKAQIDRELLNTYNQHLDYQRYLMESLK